jgi:hypothetical protein
VRDAEGARRAALPARKGRIAEATAEPGAARPRLQAGTRPKKKKPVRLALTLSEG